LDEWTQRQIDAMRLGGNGNARQFFRQHGLTDMHGKIEKKYTSKAAVSYKAELTKQVDAAAAQRGEATKNTTTTDNSVTTSGNLLENLALQDKNSSNGTLSAASNKQATTVAATPTAKLASQNAGARGKLVVTPPNSGGLPMVLRKPSNKTASSMMLKKKPSGGATKIRVNKLSTQSSSGATSTSSSVGDDVGFDSMDAVQEDTKLAQLNGTATTPVVEPVAAPPAPVVVPAPTAPAPPKGPPKSAMETGVSKLQAMNSDFFSGF
jgi:ADP-ribosylation factor GTPase-activating protein 2/3